MWHVEDLHLAALRMVASDLAGVDPAELAALVGPLAAPLGLHAAPAGAEAEAEHEAADRGGDFDLDGDDEAAYAGGWSPLTSTPAGGVVAAAGGGGGGGLEHTRGSMPCRVAADLAATAAAAATVVAAAAGVLDWSQLGGEMGNRAASCGALMGLQPGLMGLLGAQGSSIDQQMEQSLRDFVRIKTVCGGGCGSSA